MQKRYDGLCSLCLVLQARSLSSLKGKDSSEYKDRLEKEEVYKAQIFQACETSFKHLTENYFLSESEDISRLSVMYLITFFSMYLHSF